MKETTRAFASEKWSITTPTISITVYLDHGNLLWEMHGATPGMDFAPCPLSELKVQGHSLRWAYLIGTDEQQLPDGSKTFTIITQNQDNSLRLTRNISVYADYPFVRTWGTLQNISGSNILVEGCGIFSILPCSELPLAMFHVEQFSAQYRRDFFRPDEVRLIAGRAPHEIRMGSYPSQYWQPTSCAWFALLPNELDSYDRSPENGQGLVCGIEFNGKSRVRAWADPGQAQIVSQIDDLAHPLAPGCLFEIPAVFFGRFDGDWDEAGYVTQRFTEAHIHPPMPDDNYPWAQYNSWAYDQDINEAQQLHAIDRAASLGLELVVLDLGWARMIGDWRPDPIKFPRGLRPLVERAKSYGIRFGVHVALAQCSLQAPAAKEHPEWLIHTDIDYFGAAPLCLGHAPCRDWLIKQLLSLVSEEGLDYLIQDGEDMVKCCPRGDHTHGIGDSNYAGSQYGLDIVINSLREHHPDLVIENCEDGGCMMTYQMARLYHTSITVDNIDTYSTRQGIYGASYPFSPRYSVRYMQDAPTRYTLYSSIFGGPLILMHRLTEWNETQMEETRQAIVLYKQLRELVRDAKIIHLEAPRHNIPGGGWGWDAIQAITADKRHSIVMVYRAQGDVPEKILYPRGLQPESIYHVRYSESGTSLSLSGAELETNGVSVALNEFGAEILFIDPQDS